uniref:NADH dehydrogenase subunit 5 n=1 Tax=Pulchriphyllium bioculatum TaxID=58609 RepID=UPI0025A97740|nr:NADH dehydrogenase subunit 5 [Pulchriphyllium bioculatum]WID87101.1 NADH dehydrogenase subunit 5 [Pulchriphyllium bioculatum]
MLGYWFGFFLMFYFVLIGLIFVVFGFYFILVDVNYFIEYEVFMFNSVQFVMTLLFDWISLIFMGIVIFISSLIIYYSSDYMLEDSCFNRFILLVLLFVFSMMLLILSPNLISILLGWDGLGLISYCLVIYYQNIKAFNSGMITALSNRVGDSMLLMSIAWSFSYGSWNYFMYIDFFFINFDFNLISFLIIIAALTKSAQLPFSAWLPAAMAAPTPVSSLVHSSTLVTAGIYLLIRFNPLYVNSFFSFFLIFISLITMFLASFCANFEYDLKKIIAFSTLSQLGLMMFILSFGHIYMAYFHLLVHALFKASLFMCSGMIIHCFKDCQDIRYLGNLFIQMPLISICIIISSFCLCGVPFLSGFYSKDLILDIFSSGWFSMFSYFIMYFSIGLTVSYSIRLIYYLMVKDFSFCSFHSCFDVSLVMLFSTSLMVVVSIFGGCLLSWIIFSTPYFLLLPLIMKLMILFFCFVGGMVGYYLGVYGLCDFMINYFYSGIFVFFGNMWFIPFLSCSTSYYFFYFGPVVFNIVDFGWFEFIGGQGVSLLMFYFSSINQIIQISIFNLFFIMVSIWFFILFIF